MTSGLGIIGAGGIGRMHADAAVRAGVRVAGFCDVNNDAATAAAADFEDAVACADLDQLLSRTAVDAVVIAVPNAFHKAAALTALAAGVNVLLEKPMALTLAECDEVVAAAASSSSVVQVGFVCRCSPVAQLVEQLIRSGRLGKIYHARGQWYRRRGIPGLGGWFTTKEVSGGGVLIDLGVHMIDLMLHLAGRPVATRANAVCTSMFGGALGDYVHHDMWGGPVRTNGTFDVEDGMAGMIRCGRDFTMELSLAWAANIVEEEMPAEILILGDRGGARFQLWEDHISVAVEEDGQLIDLRPRLASPETVWDDGWTEQHRRFAKHCRDRTAPEASAEQGREVQAILDALYRSAEAGCEVEIA